MKIVNIILTSQNGGAEQAFVDYLVVLKKLGHEVLAVVKTDAPYAEQISAFGISLKKIKNRFGYHDIFAVKEIAGILHDFDADIAMAHIGRSMVLMNKAIKKIKKEVLLIAVNHSMNVRRSVGADVIFSVNKKAFHRTIDLGQAVDKSFVIPNAIDLEGAPEIAAEVDLRKKETVVLGAMARIDDKKGFEYLIKAIAKLKQSPQKFILKIAGLGPYEAKLRVLIKELNVENEVEFLGWIKNKKEFFASIDIFCSASDNETFGLVLLEAMKYCKPIIATNTDGSKEVLYSEIDGLIIDLKPLANLEDRIISAVLKFVNEPDFLNLLVKNGAKKVREKYSYQALENRMKEIVGKG